MPSTAASRQCSTTSCSEQLHHMCFSEWCNEQHVEDPPNNAAYCWLCVEQTLAKDSTFAKEKEEELQPAVCEDGEMSESEQDDESKSEQKIEEIEQEEASAQERNEHSDANDGIEQETGEGNGEDAVFTSKTDGSSGTTPHLRPADPKTQPDTSQVVEESGEMSWMTDGCRVLLSFGVPPTWHGGMLKYCPSFAASNDDQCSTEMYIAFDDGELRKIPRGVCYCYPHHCARTLVLQRRGRLDRKEDMPNGLVACCNR